MRRQAIPAPELLGNEAASFVRPARGGAGSRRGVRGAAEHGGALARGDVVELPPCDNAALYQDRKTLPPLTAQFVDRSQFLIAELVGGSARWRSEHCLHILPTRTDGHRTSGLQRDAKSMRQRHTPAWIRMPRRRIHTEANNGSLSWRHRRGLVEKYHMIFSTLPRKADLSSEIPTITELDNRARLQTNRNFRERRTHGNP